MRNLARDTRIGPNYTLNAQRSTHNALAAIRGKVNRGNGVNKVDRDIDDNKQVRYGRIDAGLLF